MKTSATQLNRIKATELFRSRAYVDGSANGVVKHSIGYGHQIGMSESYLLTAEISFSDGLRLLAGDVNPLEIQVNRDCKAKINQNQFDQLIDFGFNCGSGSLSKILQTFNANPKNAKAVTDEMLSYDKFHDVNGDLVINSDLAARRKSEVSIFNSPISPAVKTALIASIAVAGCYFLFS